MTIPRMGFGMAVGCSRSHQSMHSQQIRRDGCSRVGSHGAGTKSSDRQ